MTTYGYTATLTVTSCGECNIPFAMPDNLEYWARKEGRRFYCPNGHQLRYVESDLDRVKKQLAESEEKANRRLARLNEERDAHAHTTHQLHGTQGALVKVKRRISRGVCPCCTRTFSNLQKHIEDMHPAYLKANV